MRTVHRRAGVFLVRRREVGAEKSGVKKMNNALLGRRHWIKSFAWICCIGAVVSFLCPSAWAVPGGGGVGGQARYKKYPGTAEIVRVEKTAAADAKKARASEGYEVWFTFTPKGRVSNSLGKRYLEQHPQHQFVLGSSGWCPGPKFLKKYGIEKGRKFNATLMVITSGTSTPVLIELDDVPNDDYFESSGS
jgi:hypothetical protein